MSISNKYNISQDTLTQMVRDGIIPESVLRYEEVYESYKRIKLQSPAKSDTQICYDMADVMRMPCSTLQKIVSIMKKKSS